MRVLVVSNLYPPDFVGGYEQGCRQVAGALADCGHDVLVLTSAPRLPVPAEPHVRRALHLTDVWTPAFQDRHPVTRVLAHARACYVNAFNVHALLETLREFRPDVAYVWNLIGLGGLGLLAALQHQGVPWLWHLMDRVPRDLCRLPSAGDPGRLARAVGRHLEGAYLACSRRILEEIEEHAPLLRGPVALVPNWVAGPLPRARRRYAAGGHLRVVSAAARLCPEKGTDVLIAAAARLRRLGAGDFSVDLYGRLEDDTFPRRVCEAGLNGVVHFHGRVGPEELADSYADYDVFAFPTWEREPCAFAPLEAAARGCVPLLTDDCGNSEWLVHGVHCLKAERTAEAFADVLADVLAGRIDLGRLGRRAAAVVGRDFHLGRVLPAVERALGEAAGRRRAPRGPAGEAYHLAVLAEKWAETILQERVAC
jgi:glycosyltransferase involved in cell wall biosynthesis